MLRPLPRNLIHQSVKVLDPVLRRVEAVHVHEQIARERGEALEDEEHDAAGSVDGSRGLEIIQSGGMKKKEEEAAAYKESTLRTR